MERNSPWKWSKATSINLQEAHGGNFPKDPEIDSEKLPISAFQCTIQESSGNSTSWCTKSCYTVTNGRGWNSATNHSSELWWQWIFHTVPMNWITYVRKQEKILRSKFWCITSAQDGLVNEGCFHMSYIHIGPFGMSYLSKMDLLQRVPNFSYLPAWEGKHQNRSMKDIRV